MISIPQFFQAAKSKVTTYVALSIAGLSQVAEHAEEAYQQWPGLTTYLPASHYMVTASHYVLSALGLLVIYTRIRRLLGLK